MADSPSNWKLLGQLVLVVLVFATPVVTVLFRWSGQLVVGAVAFGVVGMACLGIDLVSRRRSARSP